MISLTQLIEDGPQYFVTTKQLESVIDGFRTRTQIRESFIEAQLLLEAIQNVCEAEPVVLDDAVLALRKVAGYDNDPAAPLISDSQNQKAAGYDTGL